MNCVLFAVSKVLGLPATTVAKALGHSGTNKVCVTVNDFPVVETRQGFHMQEVFRYFDVLGFSAMPFEAGPKSTWANGASLGILPHGLSPVDPDGEYFRKYAKENFIHWLRESNLALIDGINPSGSFHMYAKVGDTFYDMKGSYDFDSFMKLNFIPLTVWKVSRVKE